MTDVDPIIRNALDLLSPEENEPPEWRSIVAHAQVNGQGTADPAVIRRVRPAPRRRRNRRRSLVLLGALLVLLAILFTVPAFGLRDKLVGLFESGEPAPTRVVADFQQMDVGAPPGMAMGVRFREARKVLERQISPTEKVILWVAPARDGGFCSLIETKTIGGRSHGNYGGCRDQRSLRQLIIGPSVSIGATSAQGKIVRGPVLLDGAFRQPAAAAVRISFQDGERVLIPLRWVSAPINAGFYVYSVPRKHWTPGHLPSVVSLLDVNGKVLARDSQTVPNALDPQSNRNCSPVPCDAIRAKRRPLISITTEKGINATLWVAPSTKGGLCNWLRYGKQGSFGGGCPPPDFQLPANLIAAGNSQGAGKGREVVLFWGQVGANVASLDLHYQDGERVTLMPVEGFVLYEIPSRHYAIAHRLELILGRDRAGDTIARQPVSTTTPGSYPCSKPKKLATLVNGEPFYACP